MTTDHVVVVGAGQAGGDLAAGLRSLGYRGDVTVIGVEKAHPYSRPPLSKAYLLGSTSRDDLLIREPAMYEQQSITLRQGEKVVAIDRDEQTVRLAGGEVLAYTTLVLATGGTPRRLSELDRAPNVFTVRTLEDVDALRGSFQPARRLVVIGGGYIGLEIASVARRSGLEVVVLEAQPRVLARVTSEPVSTFFENIHRDEGVDVRVGVGIEGYGYGETGAVVSVRLASGETIPADLLLLGIGLIPHVELAEAAGLAVDNGIVVDDHLCTEDPRIYAIGDVARHPDPVHGTRRLESMPNATSQARALAETLTGSPRPYRETPWFWSDQYDIKLQSVGLQMGHDRMVVREDPEGARRLAVLYFRGRLLQAADIAGSPRAFGLAKRIIGEQVQVDADLIADPAISLPDALKMALGGADKTQSAAADMAATIPVGGAK